MMLLHGLFFGSALIQLFYLLVVFSRLAFFKKKENRQGPQLEKASVIICARDELHNLKLLLPQLYRQKHSHFEIIVVDDQSQDGTSDWLKNETANEPKLKVISVGEPPPHHNRKKHALIQGIENAQNDILVLTDADCLPESDQWLNQMVGAFWPDRQIVLGYSPYLKAKGWLNDFIQFETFLTALQYYSFALWGNPYMGVGRNLAYRKSLFKGKNGFKGFDHITGGDDDLFVNRYADSSNTQVVVGREALVWSRPKTRLKDYLRQKKRHLSVGKYYKTGDKIKLGLFSISHVVFWCSLVSLSLVGGLDLPLLALLLLRILSLYLVFFCSAKKLGEPLNYSTLLFWDFLFAFYYPFAGFLALTAKNIQWD